MSASLLRERCKQFINDRGISDDLFVDELVAFITAEKGRVPELDGTLPLALYFNNPDDRDQFMCLFKQAMPNTRTVELP